MLPNHSITSGSNPNKGKRKHSLTLTSKSNENHRLEEEAIRLEDCQIRNRQAMLQRTQATNRIECDQHNEINRLTSQVTFTEHTLLHESHQLEQQYTPLQEQATPMEDHQIPNTHIQLQLNQPNSMENNRIPVHQTNRDNHFNLNLTKSTDVSSRCHQLLECK